MSHYAHPATEEREAMLLLTGKGKSVQRIASKQ